ncbi:MAG: RNA-binding protein [Parcubacteria group bacterium Gr01-1014_30]|nr:MAG: RNA-binding protein [Parcubacteria group bacterium Gr01-1014_30]
MLNQTDAETIKKEVKDFFDKMGFEVAVETLMFEGQTLLIRVTAEEPQILIGGGGETLTAIQHLLKAILRKTLRQAQGERLEEPFYLDLDINDYKKKKVAFLRETAKEVADEVLRTGKEKELQPMSSYERRIVHMELAVREDVVSESVGEGPDRRIVVRPRV